MDRALVADVVLVVHLAYVLFVVLGEVAVLVGALREWPWVRRPVWRVAHLIATLVVPLETLAGVWCPLTRWEQDLRAAAGEEPERIGFLARLVREVLYWDFPAWVWTALYVGFGGLVLATFLLVPPRRRR
jgi:hypothetical protein